jgi:hypothetical protein
MSLRDLNAYLMSTNATVDGHKTHFRKLNSLRPNVHMHQRNSTRDRHQTLKNDQKKTVPLMSHKNINGDIFLHNVPMFRQTEFRARCFQCPAVKKKTNTNLFSVKKGNKIKMPEVHSVEHIVFRN